MNELEVTENVQRLESEDSTNNLSTSIQHPDNYWIEKGSKSQEALIKSFSIRRKNYLDEDIV